MYANVYHDCYTLKDGRGKKFRTKTFFLPFCGDSQEMFLFLSLIIVVIIFLPTIKSNAEGKKKWPKKRNQKKIKCEDSIVFVETPLYIIYTYVYILYICIR